MAAWILLAFFLWEEAPALKRAEDLHNSGLALFEKGQPDEALESIQESLRIHEQQGRKDLQIVSLRVLALIHDGLGERQKALADYQRALRLARETGDRERQARTLRDLGVLHYNLDQNAQAFAYFEQALAMQRKEAKPALIASTLFAMGELRRYYGQPEKARPLLEEALQLAREGKARREEAEALSSLAMLDLKAGKMAPVRVRLEEALAIRREIKDVRGEASTLARLGLYWDASGDSAKALMTLREAAAQFAAAKYRGGEAFARQSLATAERRAGHLEEAAAEMLRAVELAESLRQRLSDRDLRATYIGYIQNRYEFLLEAYLELDKGNPRRAFEISERARARAIVEAFSDAGVAGAAEGLPARTLAQIQSEVLDPETTLLEYALGEKKSYLFVVTRQSIETRILPRRATLEAMARKAYEAYRQAGPRPDQALMARLLLPGVKAKRLLIVAEGALQYLPFADLAAGIPVVIAPSASALAAQRARPARPAPMMRLAVFADPMAPQLARLPFARREAESVLALVPAARRMAAIGPAATREAVMKSRADIVHVAAHSVLDATRPEQTEIVLSGGSLRLRDVYKLRVEASLVVLSACQTALGKEMKREGLIGLMHAFQQAGATRVVASLWKVDDRATAELMKLFYTGVLRDGKPASLALRDAQQALAVSARWSHPFYWAGFVLQGEWR